MQGCKGRRSSTRVPKSGTLLEEFFERVVRGGEKLSKVMSEQSGHGDKYLNICTAVLGVQVVDVSAFS